MKQFVLDIYPYNEPKNARRQVVNAGKKIRIGRSFECDIILDDPYVSEEHVEISVKDDGFEIKDLGSLNGTKVKKELIREDVCLIDSGQSCVLGKTKLRFYSSMHKIGETLKNDWTKKLQEWLSHPVMAIFLLLFATVMSVLVEYKSTYDSHFLSNSAIPMMFGVPVIIGVISAVVSLFEYMQKRKSTFFITVSYVSLFFVGTELFFYIIDYYAFYFMSYSLEKLVTFVFAAFFIVLSIFTLSYIDERKISKTAYASAFFLLLIFFFFSYEGEITTFGRTDLYPRYSDALPRYMWEPTHPVSVDEFIKLGHTVFDIELPVDQSTEPQK